MSSNGKRTLRAELPLAVALGASGTAKLAGAQFTRDNFKRWGYADWWRPAIGAVEVVSGVAALAALKVEPLGKLAVLGGLSCMGGAIATHTIAGEPTYNLIPPLLVAGLAAAVLLGVTVVDDADADVQATVDAAMETVGVTQ